MINKVWGVVAAGYLAGLFMLPSLPGPYWDGPNGVAVQGLLAFSLPTAAAVTVALLIALRRRDRLRAADPNGDAVFDALLLRIAAFIIVLHVLLVAALAAIVPGRPNAGRYVLVLLGTALVLVGDLLPRLRPNQVLGVRTARAMSDGKVWATLHRSAGYGSVVVGMALIAAGGFAPGPVMPAIVLPTAALAAAAVFAAYRRALAAMVVLALLPSAAAAQGPGRMSVSDAVKARYTETRINLIDQADRMPDDRYAWRPSPEARTFGEVIAHVADTQFYVCSNLKGVANPMQGRDAVQGLASKGDYVKVLAESFALCDDVVAALTDQSAVEFVQQGPVQMPRLSVLYFVISHNAEMYGVGTVYLRANGLVPPSTEREDTRRRGR